MRKRFVLGVAWAILALLLPSARVEAQSNNPPFDVVLRNGTILDGSGGCPYKVDVGIANGAITAIGDLRSARAVVDVNVRGCSFLAGPKPVDVTDMLKRFADPALRVRIITETEEALRARFGGADGVYLPGTRQELVEVMQAQNISAGEAIVRSLELAEVRAILRFGVESDVVTFLQNPTTSIACDCGATTASAVHPRFFGTYPRVLGRYVREQKLLTWAEAIRKMTALPAATIGMVDRGFLAAGMAADVTVFDPNRIVDRATYEHPARLSQGIQHVIINGRMVLRNGQVTGEQGGRILARTGHMPSRPMSVDDSRRVSARTRLSDVRTAPSASAHEATVEPPSAAALGCLRQAQNDRSR